MALKFGIILKKIEEEEKVEKNRKRKKRIIDKRESIESWKN